VLQFRPAAASHVGLVRSHNEDSALAGRRLVVVADGMGGAAAGELASVTAVQAAEEVARRRADELGPGELLAAAVELAADRISALVEADPARGGMGTTFTGVCTDGTRVVLGQLGDSRAYLLRAEVLRQLSADHTLVQTLVDAGRLSEAQARRSSHRHIVMRSLGGGGPSVPDLVDLDLRAGDRLLLCSDGLSDLVDDATLAAVLAVPEGARAADLLVAAALDAGGTDNVTCVVVDVEVVDDDAATTAPTSTVGTFSGAAGASSRP
jgi:protein phosphatase